ncbi:hypothetical protein EVAR_8702_1 [Eumeta japonica]|uniref:Odorant receptor n=1 Tax=Eumeta variegata TaxID=151549 RepID=A0A4C1TUK7_EUMVA|nr:hypothetical protein EVAR_8702_1 [Eumeta japonica]
MTQKAVTKNTEEFVFTDVPIIKDYTHYFRIPFQLGGFLDWFSETKGPKHVFNLCYVAFLLFVQLYIVIALLTYLHKKYENLNEWIECASECLPFVASAFIISYFSCHRREFRALQETMNRRFVYRSVEGLTNMTMLECCRVAKTFAYAYTAWAGFSTTLYFVVPIVIHWMSKVGGWSFDKQRFMPPEVSQLAINLSAVNTYTFAYWMNQPTETWYMVDVNDIHNPGLEPAMEAALRECAMRSRQINRYVWRFNGFVSPLLAVKVVQVTLYLCTLLYAASRKLNIAIFEYLLAVTLDISVYCYLGSLVTTQKSVYNALNFAAVKLAAESVVNKKAEKRGRGCASRRSRAIQSDKNPRVVL